MANVEGKIRQDVKGIEDVLKAAGITEYSIFSFGSCNTSEFTKNSDVDIGILLPLPEEKLEKWKTNLPGSDVYISTLGRKIPFVHWVYNIDNFLSERFDSPLPDHPSDFEKWGNLAKYARVKYTAKTFKHLGGRSIESTLKKYSNKHVPPEEGLELFTICTRDLAKGIYENKDAKLAKAILRAVDALHIAAGYNSLNSYAEMLVAGKRTVPGQEKLLEQAYQVKVKDATFSRDGSFLRDVENFFKVVKSTIQNFAAEADYKLDQKRVNNLAEWLFGSQQTKGTAEGIVSLLAKNPGKEEYLPFAQFYIEELISVAQQKKLTLSSLPPNINLLFESVSKNLGDSLRDKTTRANIALIAKTPDEAQTIINSVDNHLLETASPEELISFEYVAAKTNIAKSNYAEAAKHYESALKQRPWNRELMWELKEVYKQAGDVQKAEASQTICSIIDGKSVYELLEVPENVKTWLSWLKDDLQSKINNNIEQLRSVNARVTMCYAARIKGASAAKLKLESHILNKQQNLLIDLESKQKLMLDKISNGSLADVAPLYRANIRNRRLVQPNLYELDTIRDELYVQDGAKHV